LTQTHPRPRKRGGYIRDEDPGKSTKMNSHSNQKRKSAQSKGCAQSGKGAPQAPWGNRRVEVRKRRKPERGK